MPPYPQMIAPVNLIQPVPRRVRALVGGTVVVDTLHALYVWEWPNYPQFYLPLGDVTPGVLVDEQHPQRLSRGTARRHAVQVGDVLRPAAARVYGADALEGLADTVRFEWDALDSWYEEDEQVFVHPRNPYTRVDALRSTREVRIELEGTVLAHGSATVMVFETGLPTRYYFDRSAVKWKHLKATDTVTSCPYKGKTTGYWSVCLPDGTVHEDLAWSYDFPTAALLPIAGLVAFYDEKVDVFLDGEPRARPVTHFFK